MKLIKLTLNLAFHDYTGVTADAIRNRLVEYLVDGLEAEVVTTSDALEKTIQTPDPDFEAEPDQIMPWQDRAREELAKPWMWTALPETDALGPCPLCGALGGCDCLRGEDEMERLRR